MINLRKGFTVPFPDKLYEGYQVNEYSIIANVNEDKTLDVVEHFIREHNEPLFFILELPARLDTEKEVRPGVVNGLHKDIYYIDGCSVEEALTIMDRVGELLINDGMSAFGFGGHNSQDEIMIEKYNVVTLYSREVEKYKGFFEKHDIGQVQELITAWDTFTPENPGQSRMYTTDGKVVYDIVEMFADWGIYHAETREE